MSAHALLREPLIDPAGAAPLHCRQVADPRASTQSTHQISERRSQVRRGQAPHLCGIFLQRAVTTILQAILARQCPRPTANQRAASAAAAGRLVIPYATAGVALSFVVRVRSTLTTCAKYGQS